MDGEPDDRVDVFRAGGVICFPIVNTQGMVNLWKQCLHFIRVRKRQSKSSPLQPSTGYTYAFSAQHRGHFIGTPPARLPRSSSQIGYLSPFRQSRLAERLGKRSLTVKTSFDRRRPSKKQLQQGESPKPHYHPDEPRDGTSFASFAALLQ